jgi:hypothetical protein
VPAHRHRLTWMDGQSELAAETAGGNRYIPKQLVMIDPLATLRATDYGSWAHTHVPNIERETAGDVTAVTRACVCGAVETGHFTSCDGRAMGRFVLAPARNDCLSWGGRHSSLSNGQDLCGGVRCRCQVAFDWVQKLTISVTF